MAIKINKKQVKTIRARCIKSVYNTENNFTFKNNKIYPFSVVRLVGNIYTHKKSEMTFNDNDFKNYFKIIKPEPMFAIDDIIKVIHRQAGTMKGIKNGLICAKKQELLDDLAINRLEHAINSLKSAYNELIEYIEVEGLWIK